MSTHQSARSLRRLAQSGLDHETAERQARASEAPATVPGQKGKRRDLPDWQQAGQALEVRCGQLLAGSG